ncbi:MAG: Uma2 family endonuclease [Pyrinomonadaceae bacterium]|nr:Uma2 family endonuclease [Pyrinomonadaceae bacterium]
MNVQTNIKSPSTVPLRRGSEIFYPESDGEPMAETDFHAKLLTDLRIALEIFFADREDVYVTGNIMFYYAEGEPKEVVSPDVMVCFGIPKGNRRSYKTWEENDVVPSVVIEISSLGTWKKDRVEKRMLYEMLGVKEYFIFNPLDLKLEFPFQAFRLKNGEFDSVKIENQRVKSEVLDLELVVKGKTLRLYNPATNEFLKTTEELAETVGELSQENSALKTEIERLKKLLENK